MVDSTIEVPITSEEVMGLKRACKIIIDAYKKHSASLLIDDENGIYPIAAADVVGLKNDVRSGLSTLNAYGNLTLDEIKRPKEKFSAENNFKTKDTDTNNYNITQSVYDKAKSETDKILNGFKKSEVRVSEETTGGSFKEDPKVQDKYSNSTPTPKAEKINPVVFSTSTPSVNSNLTDLREGIEQLPSAILDDIANSKKNNFENNTKGKFSGALGRDCIPCDLRLNGLDELKIDIKLLNPLKEMERRYKEVINKIKGLLTNTDVHADLCNLLNFLDFHCLPDLFSIVAMLMALMRKWSAALPTLDGIFLQFIGVFFAPILNGVSELLDKFIQIIMAPVDCVMDSLDAQLSKLDIKKAVDRDAIAEYSDLRRQETFLYQKLSNLKERKIYLTDLINPTDGKEGRDPSSSPPVKIGGLPRTSKAGSALAEGTRSAGDSATVGLAGLLGYKQNTEPTSANRAPSFAGKSLFPKTSISEELNQLDKDIAKTQNELDKVSKKATEVRKKESKESAWNSIMAGPGKAKETLNNFRSGLSTSLYELRNQILNARKMINDTLQLHLAELERLILGRAATSQDILTGMENIQKIARLIGIVKMLIALGKYGKLCNNNNNDPDQALGSFLSANGETGRPNYNVYKGKDANGQESLLIAPADSYLELVSPDNIEKIDNLDEIRKLNKDGIAKDLGDISNKQIKSFSPDLGIETKVSIIKFDLCTNSNFSTQPDINKIHDWATNAGLK